MSTWEWTDVYWRSLWPHKTHDRMKWWWHFIIKKSTSLWQHNVHNVWKKKKSALACNQQADKCENIISLVEIIIGWMYWNYRMHFLHKTSSFHSQCYQEDESQLDEDECWCNAKSLWTAPLNSQTELRIFVCSQVRSWRPWTDSSWAKTLWFIWPQTRELTWRKSPPVGRCTEDGMEYLKVQRVRFNADLFFRTECQVSFIATIHI